MIRDSLRVGIPSHRALLTELQRLATFAGTAADTMTHDAPTPRAQRFRSLETWCNQKIDAFRHLGVAFTEAENMDDRRAHLSDLMLLFDEIAKTTKVGNVDHLLVFRDSVSNAPPQRDGRHISSHRNSARP